MSASFQVNDTFLKLQDLKENVRLMLSELLLVFQTCVSWC